MFSYSDFPLINQHSPQLTELKRGSQTFMLYERDRASHYDLTGKHNNRQ